MGLFALMKQIFRNIEKLVKRNQSLIYSLLGKKKEISEV